MTFSLLDSFSRKSWHEFNKMRGLMRKAASCCRNIYVCLTRNSIWKPEPGSTRNTFANLEYWARGRHEPGEWPLLHRCQPKGIWEISKVKCYWKWKYVSPFKQRIIFYNLLSNRDIRYLGFPRIKTKLLIIKVKEERKGRIDGIYKMHPNLLFNDHLCLQNKHHQLEFLNKMLSTLFTGFKVEGASCSY